MARLCRVSIPETSFPDYLLIQLGIASMESLRVMPPVPLTVRIAHEQNVLDGLVIPKGTMFYIPVHISIYPRVQNSRRR